jgi:type I restriction enzyme, S subunit
MSFPTRRISDLFTGIRIGGTPSRGAPQYFGGDNLWVSIRDMEGQSLITQTAETLSDLGVENSNCKLVREGSLLFSFKLTVGRVSFAGADLYTNEAIAAFDPVDAEKAGIDLEYLSYVLPLSAKTDLTKNCMGAALLNKDKILDLVIPFPEIHEQRRVAKYLKKLLAEVETVCQSAVSQLQDAGILRTRVLADIFARLDSVETKILGDFAATASGSTPSRGIKQYWQPAKIPWVKTGEVNFSTITSTKEAISEIALAECSLTLLPAQSVLVAMIGQGKTRGQSALLAIEATTNQNCFAILPNDTWEPEFLYYWFVSSYQYLRNFSADRGGNQSALNGTLLRALRVPAPEKNRTATYHPASQVGFLRDRHTGTNEQTDVG